MKPKYVKLSNKGLSELLTNELVKWPFISQHKSKVQIKPHFGKNLRFSKIYLIEYTFVSTSKSNFCWLNSNRCSLFPSNRLCIKKTSISYKRIDTNAKKRNE